MDDEIEQEPVVGHDPYMFESAMDREGALGQEVYDIRPGRGNSRRKRRGKFRSIHDQSRQTRESRDSCFCSYSSSSHLRPTQPNTKGG
jgi:hypothetical protein